MFKLSVTKKGGSVNLGDLLKKIAKKQVYVGIPEEKAPRKKGEISNAQLMYIHTHGSPLKNIPERPVIEPAIEARGNKEPIANELKEAARAVLNGKPQEAERRLKRAGMLGQNAARAWFTDPRNGWPPDSEATVKRKLKLSKQQYGDLQEAVNQGLITASDLTQPLIDTGQLRKSITYVVKEEE